MKTNWVKVSDRLPDEFVGVLITDGTIVTAAQLVNTTPGNYFWSSYGWGGYDMERDFSEPTHWAEMPELP